MDKQSSYKLKWQNGPLVGRELILPLGEIRLGGDEPDIAIPLEQEATAILTMNNEGMWVATEASVWVDGYLWDLTQVLPLGVTIELAGIALILGVSETALPLFPVPIRVKCSPLYRHIRPITAAYRLLFWGCWRLPLWLKLTIGSIALLMTMLFLWRASGPADVKPEEDAAVWIRAQMREPGLAGLRLTENEQGTVVLQGLCKSSQDVEALRVRSLRAGLQLRDESICADTLRLRVHRTLELNGYHDIEVVTGLTLDTVEVRGAVQADDSWQRTIEQLNAIRALRGWTVKNDRATLFNKLIRMVSDGDLLDGLNIVVSGKQLQISGQLDSTRANALINVIDEFNNDGSTRLQANYQNIPSSPSATSVLPATVVSVGGSGQLIYVELANGMRLQQGSVMPSGYVIHALSRTAMALIKEQQLLSLPLDL